MTVAEMVHDFKYKNSQSTCKHLGKHIFHIILLFIHKFEKFIKWTPVCLEQRLPTIKTIHHKFSLNSFPQSFAYFAKDSKILIYVIYKREGYGMKEK